MPVLLSMEALEADRRYVERQINEAGDSPWGTARLMWQSRLADIDQQIADLAAKSSNYASVAVVFDGNLLIGSGDIQLDFTTEALESYQKVVALALASHNGVELSERGRPPAGDQGRPGLRG